MRVPQRRIFSHALLPKWRLASSEDGLTPDSFWQAWMVLDVMCVLWSYLEFLVTLGAFLKLGAVDKCNTVFISAFSALYQIYEVIKYRVLPISY